MSESDDIDSIFDELAAKGVSTKTYKILTPELEAELATLKQQKSRLDAADKLVERFISALDLIIRRLQMDIDDGSRPDQWSMESLVRTAQEALTEAAKWREGKE